MADVPHESPKQLFKKIPKWGWVLIFAGVILAALWYRHQQAAAAATAGANTQDPTGSTNPNAPATDSTGYDPNAGQGQNYYGDPSGFGNGWLPSGSPTQPGPNEHFNFTIHTGGGAPKRPNNHHQHKKHNHGHGDKGHGQHDRGRRRREHDKQSKFKRQNHNVQ